MPKGRQSHSMPSTVQGPESKCQQTLSNDSICWFSLQMEKDWENAREIIRKAFIILSNSLVTMETSFLGNMLFLVTPALLVIKNKILQLVTHLSHHLGSCLSSEEKQELNLKSLVAPMKELHEASAKIDGCVEDWGSLWLVISLSHPAFTKPMTGFAIRVMSHFPPLHRRLAAHTGVCWLPATLCL